MSETTGVEELAIHNWKFQRLTWLMINNDEILMKVDEMFMNL